MLISSIIIYSMRSYRKDDIAPVIGNVSSDQLFQVKPQRIILYLQISAEITLRKGKKKKELYFHNAREIPFAILLRRILLSLFLLDHCPSPQQEFSLFCNSTSKNKKETTKTTKCDYILEFWLRFLRAETISRHKKRRKTGKRGN